MKYLLYALLFLTIFVKNYDLVVYINLIVGIMFGVKEFKNPRTRNQLIQIFILLIVVLVIYFTKCLIVQKFLPVGFLLTMAICLFSGLLLGYILNMKLFERFKWYAVTAIVVILTSGITRKIGPGNSALITIFLIYLSSSYFIHKYYKWTSAFIIPACYILINMVFALDGGFLYVLPVMVYAILAAIISIILGRSNMKWIGNVWIWRFIFLMLLSTIWFVQENYEMWLMCKQQNNNHSSNYSFDIQLKYGEIINTQELKKAKIVVFWSANCGRCPKEFPYLSELAKKAKNVEVLCVFVSLREKDSVYFNSWIEKSYSFKWGRTLESSKVMTDLRINGFPHMTILSETDSILYNGVVSNRPWIWINHPNRFLKY